MMSNLTHGFLEAMAAVPSRDAAGITWLGRSSNRVGFNQDD